MNALKRMIYFLRPYRLMVVLMLVTTVLPVAMELLLPRLLQYVIDDGIRPHNLNAIYWGSALMFATALLGAVATLGQGVARAQISQGTAFDMRNLLFAHIQSLSYANLDQMQTGQSITCISSDVDTVRMFSSAGLALLLRAVLMVSGSMVMLFVTDLGIGYDHVRLAAGDGSDLAAVVGPCPAALSVGATAFGRAQYHCPGKSGWCACSQSLCT